MGKKITKHNILHKLPVALIIALLMTVLAFASTSDGLCDECGETLTISGPTKKDSSDHSWTLKCPNYKFLVAMDHTNETITYAHRFDVEYSNITSTKHTVTRTCNHNYTNTELLGTGGCGYTSTSTVNHAFGQFYMLGDTSTSTETQHEIRQYCACGYVKSSTLEDHDFEYKGLAPVSDCLGNFKEVMGITDGIFVVPHHHADKYVCKDCGYVKWTNVTECDSFLGYKRFKQISGNCLYHNADSYCTVCGKEYTINSSLMVRHKYSDWTFGTPVVSSDSVKLSLTHTCIDCGYTDTWTFTHQHGISDRKLIYNESTHTYRYDCSEADYDGYIIIRGDRDYEGYSSWDMYTDLGYTIEVANKAEALVKEACKNSLPASETANHEFGTASYTFLGSNKHTKKQTCTVCGYTKSVTEACTLNYSLFSQGDSEKHIYSALCECGNTDLKYEAHIDDNSDDICDICGYILSRISVTVPTSLNLTMYPDGNLVLAGSPEISNHSSGKVKITDIRITENDGWELVSYGTSMANEKVNSKKIGIKLLGYESGNDTTDYGSYHTVTLTGNDNIEKNSSLPLMFSAKASATQYAITGSTPLIIRYTIMLIRE